MTADAGSRPPAAPVPPSAGATPFIEALAGALTTAGMSAEVDRSGSAVQVTHPDTGDRTVRVTVERNVVDGWALWFVHPGGPLAPARNARSAVPLIRELLQASAPQQGPGP